MPLMVVVFIGMVLTVVYLILVLLITGLELMVEVVVVLFTGGIVVAFYLILFLLATLPLLVVVLFH